MSDDMVEIQLRPNWVIGKCAAGKLRVCGTIDDHPTREPGELIRSREIVRIKRGLDSLIAYTKTAEYTLLLQ